jgi:hypothetical protein
LYVFVFAFTLIFLVKVALPLYLSVLPLYRPGLLCRTTVVPSPLH